MICTTEDEFIRELQEDRGQALWKAKLSDGSVVIMDDHRPGVQPHSAWTRLYQHCEANDVHITKFWIQFRDNVFADILPENADGYFFSKSCLAVMSEIDTINLFVMGALHEGRLVVQKWHVPDLTKIDEEERDPNYSGPCLIKKKNEVSGPAQA